MSPAQVTAMDEFKDSVKYNYLSSSDKSRVDEIMKGLQNSTIQTIDSDLEDELEAIAKRGADNEASAKANKYYSDKATVDGINDFVSKVCDDSDVSFTLASDTTGKTINFSTASKEEIKEYLSENAGTIDAKYNTFKDAMSGTDGATPPNPLVSIAASTDYTQATTDERAEAMANAIISARDNYIQKQKAEHFTEYQNAAVGDPGIANAIENGISSSDLSAIAVNASDASEYTFESRTVREGIIDGTQTGTSVASAVASFQTNFAGNSVSSNGNELAALGLENLDAAKLSAGDQPSDNGMAIITAKDTEVYFNGAKLTSTDTNISVAGLELNLLSADPDEEITITVTNDVSAIYDTIKEFLTEYNSILKELNTNYNAASAKDYDVLTDEQKDAMSDTEVEKWEAKIKDSLLRRDSTLGNLVSSMRNNMMGAFVGSDGKRYSLATLGIVTSGDYAEGGLLHIKGDEDDTEYAEENNVLMSMLQEDPDKVMEILTHFSSTLYDDLQKKMGRTALSSALTFYNDKEMSSQLSDYKKEISKWETKLNDMEDRYYSQFTAMESALAKLQSQQSALSQYLGM